MRREERSQEGKRGTIANNDIVMQLYYLVSVPLATNLDYLERCDLSKFSRAPSARAYINITISISSCFTAAEIHMFHGSVRCRREMHCIS